MKRYITMKHYITMNKLIIIILILFILWGLSGCDFLKGGTITSPAFEEAFSADSLKISGAMFNTAGMNGFMLGISYYGALGIADESKIKRDLDDMQKYGFNWFRVWAIWDIVGENVSAITSYGTVREPYMSRLKNLISEASKRGLTVDITLMRHNSPFPSNFGDHLACVATLAHELKPYRNAYFDVANECNFHDTPNYVSPTEVGDLITTLKSIDPGRLATASFAHISGKELQEYITIGKIDFVAPHMGFNSFEGIVTLQNAMSEIGETLPINMQETFRNGYESESYTAQDFMSDYEGTKLAGGAGWCLHNGSSRPTLGGEFLPPHKSFWMKEPEKRLFEQLDEEEMGAIEQF